jgi:hypothetical protein
MMQGKSIVFPEVVLQWLVENVSSDVELATLSNVSTSWRKYVNKTLIYIASNERSSNGTRNKIYPSHSLLLPSMIRFSRVTESTSSFLSLEKKDTFCAAWFPPTGIHTIPVSTQPLDVRRNQQNSSSRRRSWKSESRMCCIAWHGYFSAVQVLTPFGYEPKFLQSLFSSSAWESMSSSKRQEMSSETTFAVRGATMARPEGYCLCWETFHVASNSGKIDPKSYSKILYDYSNVQNVEVLQRQALPRVITCPQLKNRTISEKDNVDNPKTETRDKNLAVQFLNASGSAAVRMMTPLFLCGPLTRPVTLFCVGIATEDGCFMSGLTRRCEFGHMYPQCERDGIIDMSPICICTGADHDDDDEEEDDDDYDRFAVSNLVRNKYSLSLTRGDDNETQQTFKPIGNSGISCGCPFHLSKVNGGLFDSTSGRDEEEDGDDKPPDYAHKGQRGPGQWHCYVAIVDGMQSTIRIDGVPEKMIRYVNNANSSDKYLLDGLTIGSDHAFNMSLSCGDGPPGEGEGSIAELIVFQGRLPIPDIEALERKLMKQHGILPTPPGLEHDLVQQEDEWKRDSRALIEQPAPYDLIVIPEGVPLRAVTNDPSVSWNRYNAVTGERMTVSRIGCRSNQDSSDW